MITEVLVAAIIALGFVLGVGTLAFLALAVAVARLGGTLPSQAQLMDEKS